MAAAVVTGERGRPGSARTGSSALPRTATWPARFTPWLTIPAKVGQAEHEDRAMQRLGRDLGPDSATKPVAQASRADTARGRHQVQPQVVETIRTATASSAMVRYRSLHRQARPVVQRWPVTDAAITITSATRQRHAAAPPVSAW